MDGHRYLVVRTVVEQVSAHYPIWSFELSDDRVIVVVLDPRNDMSADSILSGLMRKIARNSKICSGLIVSSGYFHRGFSGLCRSFDQAIASFEYRAAVDKEGDLAGSGMVALPPKSVTYPCDVALQIIRSIRLNNLDLLARHLRIFDRGNVRLAN